MSDPADKFLLQDSQYSYPYHHIPFVDSRGVPRRIRGIDWGFEYLCYQLHARETICALAPRSALEIGCGDGRFIGMLAPVLKRAVGVDLSDASIRFARAFHPEVEFHCSDASIAGTDFHVVAAIEVLEHVPDHAIAAFLTTASNAVRSGGHLVISVPTKNVPVHRKHYRHYDDELLLEQVTSAGVPLKCVKLEYVFHQPAHIRWLLKLTYNKYLILDSPVLNRMIWRRLWTRGRVVRKDQGRHILAVFQRV